MKRIALYLVFFLFLFSACKKESNKESQSLDIGDFSFSSEDIIANEPFQITYNGNETLDESFYNQLNHTKIYPSDLYFKNNTATITIPDSISAVVFNFKVGKDFAKNKKEGFIFSVLNKEGKTKTDAEASKQYYILNYGESYGIEGKKPIDFIVDIENVIKEEPKSKYDWFNIHLYLAKQVDAKKGKEISNKYLKDCYSKTEKSLEDYEIISNIYSTLKDSKKADSISEIVKEKYPNSDLAIQPEINKFYKATDLKTKESIFNKHRDYFLNYKNANYILQNLAISNYNSGNIEAFYSYIDMIDSKTSKASLFNDFAWSNAEKYKDLDVAKSLSKKSLELIKEEQITIKEKSEYFSLNQYKKSLENTFKMYADTYALLAFKTDNVKEAIKFQSIATEGEANAEMNERYIKFLMADQQYNTVIEKASVFIKEGRSTEKIKLNFKEASTKLNINKDVDKLLATLEAEAKEKELNEIRESLIDEEAPDFSIKNLADDEITLSSLKGKTVILDFWATWCGPCIASFPGMQKVVTKYKDNDNIVFLFVDTFESGDDRIKKVSKFIKDNKYDFNVLIDPKNETGSNYNVATAYKVTGIPTKVIIGPTGRINFKSVGYGGSDEKIVSEIETMVEILKD